MRVSRADALLWFVTFVSSFSPFCFSRRPSDHPWDFLPVGPFCFFLPWRCPYVSIQSFHFWFVTHGDWFFVRLCSRYGVFLSFSGRLGALFLEGIFVGSVCCGFCAFVLVVGAWDPPSQLPHSISQAVLEWFAGGLALLGVG